MPPQNFCKFRGALDAWARVCTEKRGTLLSEKDIEGMLAPIKRTNRSWLSMKKRTPDEFADDVRYFCQSLGIFFQYGTLPDVRNMWRWVEKQICSRESTSKNFNVYSIHWYLLLSVALRKMNVDVFADMMERSLASLTARRDPEGEDSTKAPFMETEIRQTAFSQVILFLWGCACVSMNELQEQWGGNKAEQNELRNQQVCEALQRFGCGYEVLDGEERPPGLIEELARGKIHLTDYTLKTQVFLITFKNAIEGRFSRPVDSRCASTVGGKGSEMNNKYSSRVDGDDDCDNENAEQNGKGEVASFEKSVMNYFDSLEKLKAFLCQRPVTNSGSGAGKNSSDTSHGDGCDAKQQGINPEDGDVGNTEDFAAAPAILYRSFFMTVALLCDRLLYCYEIARCKKGKPHHVAPILTDALDHLSVAFPSCLSQSAAGANEGIKSEIEEEDPSLEEDILEGSAEHAEAEIERSADIFRLLNCKLTCLVYEASICNPLLQKAKVLRGFPTMVLRAYYDRVLTEGSGAGKDKELKDEEQTRMASYVNNVQNQFSRLTSVVRQNQTKPQRPQQTTHSKFNPSCSKCYLMRLVPTLTEEELDYIAGPHNEESAGTLQYTHFVVQRCLRSAVDAVISDMTDLQKHKDKLVSIRLECKVAQELNGKFFDYLQKEKGNMHPVLHNILRDYIMDQLEIIRDKSKKTIEVLFSGAEGGNVKRIGHIQGLDLTLLDVKKDIEKLVQREHCDAICISDKGLFKLNTSLTIQGVAFKVVADQILVCSAAAESVHGEMGITIDTSGKDGEKGSDAEQGGRVRSGNVNDGKCGLDGAPGQPGQDAGSIHLESRSGLQFENPATTLRLRSLGGRGGQGGNAGKGENGKSVEDMEDGNEQYTLEVLKEEVKKRGYWRSATALAAVKPLFNPALPGRGGDSGQFGRGGFGGRSVPPHVSPLKDADLDAKQLVCEPSPRYYPTEGLDENKNGATTRSGHLPVHVLGYDGSDGKKAAAGIAGKGGWDGKAYVVKARLSGTIWTNLKLFEEYMFFGSREFDGCSITYLDRSKASTSRLILNYRHWWNDKSLNWKHFRVAGTENMQKERGARRFVNNGIVIDREDGVERGRGGAVYEQAALTTWESLQANEKEGKLQSAWIAICGSLSFLQQCARDFDVNDKTYSLGQTDYESMMMELEQLDQAMESAGDLLVFGSLLLSGQHTQEQRQSEQHNIMMDAPPTAPDMNEPAAELNSSLNRFRDVFHNVSHKKDKFSIPRLLYSSFFSEGVGLKLIHIFNGLVGVLGRDATSRRDTPPVGLLQCLAALNATIDALSTSDIEMVRCYANAIRRNAESLWLPLLISADAKDLLREFSAHRYSGILLFQELVYRALCFHRAYYFVQHCLANRDGFPGQGYGETIEGRKRLEKARYIVQTMLTSSSVDIPSKLKELEAFKLGGIVLLECPFFSPHVTVVSCGNDLTAAVQKLVEQTFLVCGTEEQNNAVRQSLKRCWELYGNAWERAFRCGDESWKADNKERSANSLHRSRNCEQEDSPYFLMNTQNAYIKSGWIHSLFVWMEALQRVYRPDISVEMLKEYKLVQRVLTRIMRQGPSSLVTLAGNEASLNLSMLKKARSTSSGHVEASREAADRGVEALNSDSTDTDSMVHTTWSKMAMLMPSSALYTLRGCMEMLQHWQIEVRSLVTVESQFFLIAAYVVNRSSHPFDYIEESEMRLVFSGLQRLNDLEDKEDCQRSKAVRKWMSASVDSVYDSSLLTLEKAKKIMNCWMQVMWCVHKSKRSWKLVRQAQSKWSTENHSPDMQQGNPAEENTDDSVNGERTSYATAALSDRYHLRRTLEQFTTLKALRAAALVKLMEYAEKIFWRKQRKNRHQAGVIFDHIVPHCACDLRVQKAEKDEPRNYEDLRKKVSENRDGFALVPRLPCLKCCKWVREAEGELLTPDECAVLKAIQIGNDISFLRLLFVFTTHACESLVWNPKGGIECFLRHFQWVKGLKQCCVFGSKSELLDIDKFAIKMDDDEKLLKNGLPVSSGSKFNTVMKNFISWAEGNKDVQESLLIELDDLGRSDSQTFGISGRSGSSSLDYVRLVLIPLTHRQRTSTEGGANSDKDPRTSFRLPSRPSSLEVFFQRLAEEESEKNVSKLKEHLQNIINIARALPRDRGEDELYENIKDELNTFLYSVHQSGEVELYKEKLVRQHYAVVLIKMFKAVYYPCLHKFKQGHPEKKKQLQTELDNGITLIKRFVEDAALPVVGLMLSYLQTLTPLDFPSDNVTLGPPSIGKSSSFDTNYDRRRRVSLDLLFPVLDNLCGLCVHTEEDLLMEFSGKGVSTWITSVRQLAMIQAVQLWSPRDFSHSMEEVIMSMAYQVNLRELSRCFQFARSLVKEDFRSGRVMYLMRKSKAPDYEKWKLDVAWSKEPSEWRETVKMFEKDEMNRRRKVRKGRKEDLKREWCNAVEELKRNGIVVKDNVLTIGKELLDDIKRETSSANCTSALDAAAENKFFEEAIKNRYEDRSDLRKYLDWLAKKLGGQPVFNGVRRSLDVVRTNEKVLWFENTDILKRALKTIFLAYYDSYKLIPSADQVLAVILLMRDGDSCLANILPSAGKTFITGVCSVLKIYLGYSVMFITVNGALINEAWKQGVKVLDRLLGRMRPRGAVSLAEKLSSQVGDRDALYAHLMLYGTMHEAIGDIERAWQQRATHSHVLQWFDAPNWLIMDEADLPMIENFHDAVYIGITKMASLKEQTVFPLTLSEAIKIRDGYGDKNEAIEHMAECLLPVVHDEDDAIIQERRLRKMLDSADRAMTVRKDEEYVQVAEGSHLSNGRSTAPYNKATGSTMRGSVWKDGVSSMVNMYNGLSVKPESSSILVLSNCSFIQMFHGRITAVTGTAGNDLTRLIYNQEYGMNVTSIPSAYSSQLMYCIPRVARSVKERQNMVEHVVKEAVRLGQSVLIISETVREAQEQLESMQNFCDKSLGPLNSVRCCRYALEEDEKPVLNPDKNEQLIICATNLGGRGMHLDTKAIEGLCVISLKPQCDRTTAQADQRAGRRGEIGVAIHIYYAVSAAEPPELLYNPSCDEDGYTESESVEDLSKELRYLTPFFRERNQAYMLEERRLLAIPMKACEVEFRDELQSRLLDHLEQLAVVNDGKDDQETVRACYQYLVSARYTDWLECHEDQMRRGEAFCREKCEQYRESLNHLLEEVRSPKRAGDKMLTSEVLKQERDTLKRLIRTPEELLFLLFHHGYEKVRELQWLFPAEVTDTLMSTCEFGTAPLYQLLSRLPKDGKLRPSWDEHECQHARCSVAHFTERMGVWAKQFRRSRTDLEKLFIWGDHQDMSQCAALAQLARYENIFQALEEYGRSLVGNSVDGRVEYAALVSHCRDAEAFPSGRRGADLIEELLSREVLEISEPLSCIKDFGASTITRIWKHIFDWSSGEGILNDDDKVSPPEGFQGFAVYDDLYMNTLKASEKKKEKSRRRSLPWTEAHFEEALKNEMNSERLNNLPFLLKGYPRVICALLHVLHTMLSESSDQVEDLVGRCFEELVHAKLVSPLRIHSSLLHGHDEDYEIDVTARLARSWVPQTWILPILKVLISSAGVLRVKNVAQLGVKPVQDIIPVLKHPNMSMDELICYGLHFNVAVERPPHCERIKEQNRLKGKWVYRFCQWAKGVSPDWLTNGVTGCLTTLKNGVKWVWKCASAAVKIGVERVRNAFGVLSDYLKNTTFYRMLEKASQLLKMAWQPFFDKWCSIIGVASRTIMPPIRVIGREFRTRMTNAKAKIIKAYHSVTRFVRSMFGNPFTTNRAFQGAQMMTASPDFEESFARASCRTQFIENLCKTGLDALEKRKDSATQEILSRVMILVVHEAVGIHRAMSGGHNQRPVINAETAIRPVLQNSGVQKTMRDIVKCELGYFTDSIMKLQQHKDEDWSRTKKKQADAIRQKGVKAAADGSQCGPHHNTESNKAFSGEQKNGNKPRTGKDPALQYCSTTIMNVVQIVDHAAKMALNVNSGSQQEMKTLTTDTAQKLKELMEKLWRLCGVTRPPDRGLGATWSGVRTEDEVKYSQRITGIVSDLVKPVVVEGWAKLIHTGKETVQHVERVSKKMAQTNKWMSSNVIKELELRMAETSFCHYKSAGYGSARLPPFTPSRESPEENSEQTMQLAPLALVMPERLLFALRDADDNSDIANATNSKDVNKGEKSLADDGIDLSFVGCTTSHCNRKHDPCCCLCFRSGEVTREIYHLLTLLKYYSMEYEVDLNGATALSRDIPWFPDLVLVMSLVMASSSAWCTLDDGKRRQQGSLRRRPRRFPQLRYIVNHLHIFEYERQAVLEIRKKLCACLSSLCRESHVNTHNTSCGVSADISLSAMHLLCAWEAEAVRSGSLFVHIAMRHLEYRAQHRTAQGACDAMKRGRMRGCPPLSPSSGCPTWISPGGALGEHGMLEMCRYPIGELAFMSASLVQWEKLLGCFCSNIAVSHARRLSPSAQHRWFTHFAFLLDGVSNTCEKFAGSPLWWCGGLCLSSDGCSWADRLNVERHKKQVVLFLASRVRYVHEALRKRLEAHEKDAKANWDVACQALRRCCNDNGLSCTQTKEMVWLAHYGAVTVLYINLVADEAKVDGDKVKVDDNEVKQDAGVDTPIHTSADMPKDEFPPHSEGQNETSEQAQQNDSKTSRSDSVITPSNHLFMLMQLAALFFAGVFLIWSIWDKMKWLTCVFCLCTVVFLLFS